MAKNNDKSPDIFISYAHIDNSPLPGAEKGWVQNFVNGLRIYLNRQMGRSENYKLWMDFELRGNTPLTADIMDHLKAAKTLVLFLSPAYVASKWCCDELQTFLQQAKASEKRVFVVELDSMAQEDRPAELSDLLGYRFWYKNDQGRIRQYGIPKPDPEEEEYYNLLLDLSHDLSDKIKELQKKFPAQDEEESGTTIYLAPVSDQLEALRNRVARFLDQYKINTLPNTNCFRLSEDSIEDDFTKCSHFIQLLDENSSMGVPRALHDLAEKQSLEIIEWRDVQLNLDAVESSDHLALLQGVSVIACHLSEFTEELLSKLQPQKPKPELPDRSNQVVFVNAGVGDNALLQKIAVKLTDLNIPYILPMNNPENASPAEMREDMEDNLLMCDSMLLIYHNSPRKQIREFLKYGFKINAKRETPLQTTICKLEDNQPLNLKLPHMKTLECVQQFEDCCLDRFLAGEV